MEPLSVETACTIKHDGGGYQGFSRPPGIGFRDELKKTCFKF